MRAAAALLVVAAMAATASAQRGRGSVAAADNVDYNGRFVFTRIRYGTGGGWGWGFRGSSWAHDYPRADLHLPRIVQEVTTVAAHVDGSNVYDLDDPEMFQFPLIYISEPGFWTMSEREADGLRQYLLKGGFAIFDDFENEQWENFAEQMRRVLPEHRPLEIGIDHPIFHSFFEMKTIDIPHPLVPVRPKYYGIFEGNRPTGRMMSIVNYNNDLAEYWEWSAEGMFPVDITNDAYKFGVNYVVYALTH